MTVLDVLCEKILGEKDFANKAEIKYRIYVLESLKDLKMDAYKVSDIEAFTKHQKCFSFLLNLLVTSDLEPWKARKLDEYLRRIANKYNFFSKQRDYGKSFEHDADLITAEWYQTRQTIIKI